MGVCFWQSVQRRLQSTNKLHSIATPSHARYTFIIGLLVTPTATTPRVFVHDKLAGAVSASAVHVNNLSSRACDYFAIVR